MDDPINTSARIMWTSCLQVVAIKCSQITEKTLPDILFNKNSPLRIGAVPHIPEA
jgi:hypothetical protein